MILNGTGYSIQRHEFDVGTCVFIKNKFVDYLRVDVPEKYSGLDIVCIDLIGLETNYRFINCYRPPYQDRNAFDLMILMVECFDMLYDTNASVILVGDMNFPSANWSSSSVIYDNVNCESKFMNFVRNNALI